MITLEAWKQEGLDQFGKDPNWWRFKCPSCGHVQTRADWLALGMRGDQAERYLGFSCIGRWLKGTGPSVDVVDALEGLSKGYGCDYLGGSIFNISPLDVTIPAKGGSYARYTFGWDESVAFAGDPKTIEAPMPRTEQCWRCYGDKVQCVWCGRHPVDCSCATEKLESCDECCD